MAAFIAERERDTVGAPISKFSVHGASMILGLVSHIIGM
jgi:hypothetical protein